MVAGDSWRTGAWALVKPAAFYLKRPLRLFRTYDRGNLRPDLIAGLTVSVILLPQAIAFALIAELPPQMGLYAAIVGALFGALWGSSNQIHTGPTNAISLLVFSSLAGIVAVGTPEYIIAAGMMAIMAGVLQLVMGLARLGILVNFVSHSVIVGFSTGAGILIIMRQIGPLFGIQLSNKNILDTLISAATSLPGSHLSTTLVGLGTMVFILLLRRYRPGLPSALLGMIAASAVVFIFNLEEQGVAVIGQLPRSLPPLADLPLFDTELIAQLSAGALAVAAIGLVETAAISRSVATQTSQRLDSNQEFVGQGMANIASGLFSGYVGAGSFSRTAVNFKAGARSPMAAIFSALFVLVAIFALGPLATYLPVSSLAAVLIITAYSLIDKAEIVRIWHGAAGDAAIMIVTLVGTLVLHIEYAVLAGITLSFVLYVVRTSTPRVQAVLPDTSFKHFSYQPDQPSCPQLLIVEILGELYFGAVNHVEEKILHFLDEHPEQRFLLLRMHSVDHIDYSGIHMLESVVHTYRERGGDVFLVRVSYPVRKLMESTGFMDYLKRGNVLDDDNAISHLFLRHLDPAICIYECPWRVFHECQNLPKRSDLLSVPHTTRDIAEEEFDLIAPKLLWQKLHTTGHPEAPTVIDVREPREFKRGHIAEANLIPLADIIRQAPDLPKDAALVITCRSGRRSRRAADALRQQGFGNVTILDGGMVAWEAAGLLEAVEL
jgi:sulfate permease, SulP family